MRPYTPEHLTELCNHARALARAGRSKLSQLRHAVIQSPARAALDYQLAEIHWPNKAARPGALVEALADGRDHRACWLGPTKDEDGQPIDDVLRTPFLDLAEVLELLPTELPSEAEREAEA